MGSVYGAHLQLQATEDLTADDHLGTVYFFSPMVPLHNFHAFTIRLSRPGKKRTQVQDPGGEEGGP